MSDVDFIDTNVFIYLFDRQDERRRRIAEQLVLSYVQSGNGVISFQVVQETLNVFTRKVSKNSAGADLHRILHEVLAPLWKINASSELYSRAIDVRERYQFSFYDSLIVSAALEGGCRRLLSEDLQHGQQIEQLTIENPFRVPS